MPSEYPDVHFAPAPEDVLAPMLELASVQPTDLVYDLGCGDGRIVIAAAKLYRARAIGFDLDSSLVLQARANVRAAGVSGLVAIQHADIFSLDLSHATVITLYLLSLMNVRLIPQLLRVKPGTRIVSLDFPLAEYPPCKMVKVRETDRRERELYLWRTPLER